tara:strand:- start:152 stop:562 length:411 start_codon:yes stop_codon:yes gene_type:complete
MSSRFATGRLAIAECDRCGFRYQLKELRALTIKTKVTNILVCPTCWEPDQPQLQLGLYPVDDPQALRNPRPDNSYWQSGLGGLQLTTSDYGTPGEGSRVIQWGWNPVGLNNPLQLTGLTNALQAEGQVGTVTVTTT